MALFQYKLAVLPASIFKELAPSIPNALTEEERNQILDLPNVFWNNEQPSENFIAQVRALCPSEKSWGETEEFVTEGELPSQLQIWRNVRGVWSIELKYSVANDPFELLQKFLSLCRAENYLLLEDQTGAILAPDEKIVAQHLLDSRAMKFAQKPIETILEAAKEFREKESKEE